MKEKTRVGHLWDLVQQFLDDQAFPVSERQLAQKLGYASSSTFDGWRNPRKLPAAQGLARFAVTAGVSYQRVLDAALEDAGYLPRPEITSEPLGLRRVNRLDDEFDGPAPKVADVLADRRRRGQPQVPALSDAARDVGKLSKGQQRQRAAEAASEPETDDPNDMEPR